ncbi:hypothetical protein EBR66_07150 [bacterium]|nr:hypothetical protein [bacterium]
MTEARDKAIIPAADSVWFDNQEQRTVRVTGCHAEFKTSVDAPRIDDQHWTFLVSHKPRVLVLFKHGDRPYDVGSEWAHNWACRFTEEQA